MYLEHFGLREAPFGLTPDTQFFIACGGYQEALNTLLIAVKNGEGFIKITGDVGAGKTILCRKFLASLDKEEFTTAYMHNPYLDPRTLLLALAEELEVPIEKGLDQYQLLRALNLGLLNIARQKKRAVLCLDEAQAMPLETLEALRLLTNLETEKRKLLQVVLFGQPELDQKLQQESVRQLKQRITFHFQLLPLNKEEMKYYVTQRLSIAGYRGGPLFSHEAIDLLYHASGGIPRLTNILAHKSLMLAYGQGKHQVGTGHVRCAVIDTPSVPQRPARRWAWWLAGGLALVAVAATAWIGMMRA